MEQLVIFHVVWNYNMSSCIIKILLIYKLMCGNLATLKNISQDGDIFRKMKQQLTRKYLHFFLHYISICLFNVNNARVEIARYYKYIRERSPTHLFLNAVPYGRFAVLDWVNIYYTVLGKYAVIYVNTRCGRLFNKRPVVIERPALPAPLL